MDRWNPIRTPRALEIAAQEGIARPGTFSAAAVTWTGNGKAPSEVTIAGALTCGYCGRRSDFSVSGMSGSVACAGCGSAYSLMSTACAIDGADGRVLVATVFSHHRATGLVPPRIDILDVADYAPPAVRQSPAPPAIYSSECSDRSTVKAYIDGGGDVNARDAQQWTLLHRAAFMDDVEAVRVLLENGANPDLPVLPGGSRRTSEIVADNGMPHAEEIVAMLAASRVQPRSGRPAAPHLPVPAGLAAGAAGLAGYALAALLVAIDPGGLFTNWFVSIVPQALDSATFSYSLWDSLGPAGKVFVPCAFFLPLVVAVAFAARVETVGRARFAVPVAFLAGAGLWFCVSLLMASAMGGPSAASDSMREIAKFLVAAAIPAALIAVTTARAAK